MDTNNIALKQWVEKIERICKPKDIHNMWKNLTWNNYLVWNDDHKNYIKKL